MAIPFFAHEHPKNPYERYQSPPIVSPDPYERYQSPPIIRKPVVYGGDIKYNTNGGFCDE
ncbi:hypothetical protein G9A89_015309 [Geosiphon pyriformis]|nr:hypothetical protein G9A89_015309 [Geosiphon pyriformis]